MLTKRRQLRRAVVQITLWPGSAARSPSCTLLPTPAAGNFNDGESLDSWRARRIRQKALGRNGNGAGAPLAIAVRLLPTPRASDWGTAGRRPGAGFGPPLSAVLLPTPRATDATKGSPNQRGSRGDLTLPSAAARIGVHSGPPSSAGRRSWAGPRLPQPNPEEPDSPD